MRLRVRDGKESVDLSELIYLVDNFLNLMGKFLGRSDIDGLKISVSCGYKVKELEKKIYLRGGDGRIDLV